MFAIPFALWLRLNRAPPNWDDSWYLSNSLTFYDAWHIGGLPGMVRAFLASLGYKAPLIVTLPAPFYWIFGRRWHAAFLVNAASMALLFAVVYQIGKLLRGARAGFIAVYIAGTLPLLYGLARWYMVEYSLAALVATAFWLALVARASESLIPAAGLGTICGLGLLLKADFPLFVLPVLIYLFVRRRGHRPRLFLSLMLPCAVLAAPWYAYHWRATWDHAWDSGYGVSAALYSKTTLVYLSHVVTQGVSLYYALLGAAVLIAVILQRRFDVFRRIAPLWLWLLPFLVFLLGENKDIRLMAPVLPAFALIVACMLDATTEHKKEIAVAALISPS